MKKTVCVLSLIVFFSDLSVGEENLRVDCSPDLHASTQDTCKARGCTWSPPTQDKDAPSCFFPPDYGYTGSCGDVYQVEGGYMVNLTKSGSNTLFGKDFQQITIFWEFQSKTRLRVKIFPSNVDRYEVPITIDRQAHLTEDDLDVLLDMCDDSLGN